MIVILGALIVTASIIGGFMMAGGHVGALIHVSEFIVIGGATAITEWNSLVAASQSTNSKTMVFVDIADIDTTTKAEDLHDASVAFARVFSLADDVANFSGAQPLSLYMELSNGAPQTYTKINDGSGRTVVWGFDY